MLPAILGGVSLLGSIFGGAGKGQAQERGNANDYVAQNYRTQQQALLQLLGLDERATMDRAQLGIAAPAARAKQAAIGSMLSRLQPSQISAPSHIRVPQISGGLSGAMGGPGMKAAGEMLQLQALKALLSGSDVPGAANYAQRGMLQAPAYQKAGKGESLLSALGLAGGLAGALAPLLKKQTNPSSLGGAL